MKEIKIFNNEQIVRMIIDDYKVMVSESTETKLTLLDQIKNYFMQQVESEYFKVHSNIKILLNDITVDFKHVVISEINPLMDLNDFLKLTSKSVAFKMIEAKLGDIEYDDLFQTFSHMHKLISDEIVTGRTEIVLEDIVMSFHLDNLNLKQLVKLMSHSFFKNGYQANQFDLTPDEKIRFCLRFLYESASTNSDLDFFVFLNYVDIDDSLLNLLKNQPQNMYTLINPIKIKSQLLKEKVFYIGKDYVDFASEEDLYEKVLLKSSDTNDLSEFNITLKRIFNSVDFNSFNNHSLFKNL